MNKYRDKADTFMKEDVAKRKLSLHIAKNGLFKALPLTDLDKYVEADILLHRAILDRALLDCVHRPIKSQEDVPKTVEECLKIKNSALDYFTEKGRDFESTCHSANLDVKEVEAVFNSVYPLLVNKVTLGKALKICRLLKRMIPNGV